MSGGQSAVPTIDPLLFLPQYQAPPTAAGYAGMIPPVNSESQNVQQGVAADQQLPTNLQLTSQNPLIGNSQGQGLSNYEQAFSQNQVMPQLAALQSQLGLSGEGESSFGGAQLGQAQAQGAVQTLLQGQGFYNNQLSNLLNERQSLFGNDVAGAQQANLANVARGQSLAQLAQNSAAMGNQFQLGQFGETNSLYNTEMGYNSQINAANEQNQMGMFNGFSKLLGGAAGGGFGAIGGGGGGGGFGGGGSAMNSIGQGFGAGLNGIGNLLQGNGFNQGGGSFTQGGYTGGIPVGGGFTPSMM